MFGFVIISLSSGVACQAQVRGSLDASQLAVNSFTFVIAAPQNCLRTSADLPTGVSKNMAALWIRAAFHDAGTWAPLESSKGGAGTSLLAHLNETENLGLSESIATKFMQNPRVNMSKADMIALAGQVAITHCGGPSMPFYPGRIDSLQSVSPVGRIPRGNANLAETRPVFERLGWSNEDIVALVTGSHTMGGVHTLNSKDVTSKTFLPFDDTAGIFDNHIFKSTLQGKCAIKLDCDIASDPVLRPIVQRFADNQTAFFEQYAISYVKLTGQTDAILGHGQALNITLHVGLEDTLQPPTDYDYTPSTSTPPANVRNSTTSGTILCTTISISLSTYLILQIILYSV